MQIVGAHNMTLIALLLRLMVYWLGVYLGLLVTRKLSAFPAFVALVCALIITVLPILYGILERQLFTKKKDPSPPK